MIKLTREQRDQLQVEARELERRADAIVSALRAEAERESAPLYAKARELRKQAESDADREIAALEAQGRKFHKAVDGGVRIEAGGRSAVATGPMMGCCLTRLYDHMRDPSYAPREGDRLPCSKLCSNSGVGGVMVFTEKRWRWIHGDA